MAEDKQGLVWSSSKPKIPDGCKEGVTYTTLDEMMGDIGKNMYFPVFGKRDMRLRQ